MAKNNFYAVRQGKKVGLFDNWNDTKLSVTGYPGAEYKGFPTKEEALTYLNGSNEIAIDSVPTKESEIDNDKIEVYVDGSFRENLQAVGYGVVFVKNNEKLFSDCGKVPAKDLTERQVIGEIFATIRTIQLCIANGINNICICYDYDGIEKWATGSWKAKKPLTQRYVEYFNQYKNKINISFKHVKGHSGVIFNEEADRLAKLGCTF